MSIVSQSPSSIVRIGAAAVFLCGLKLANPVPCSAQGQMASPGSQRCPDCALSGQTPAAFAFDAAQIEFISVTGPAFNMGRTFQVALIARVLSATPLVLEVLDGQSQLLDEKMAVVERGGEKTPSGCSIQRIGTVDLTSKQVVSALEFNDLITATWRLAPGVRNPDSFLGGTPYLTEIVRVLEPIRYFNDGPRDTTCNRAGRLMVYDDLVSDLVEVFNDGSIFFRDSTFRSFTRARLSRAELSDLLQAFASVKFDKMPTTFPAADGSRHSATLTLMAARYQTVSLAGRESALAPLIRQMEDLAARATADVSYVLMPGRPQKISIRPWPYTSIPLARYRELRERDALPMQRLPDEFLGQLPQTYPSSGFDADPNRYVYFSDAGRLHRVTYNAGCIPADSPICKTFRTLDAAEVEVPEASRDLVGGLDYRLPGSFLTARRSGYLWSPAMGITLGVVPPAGMIISRDEYERHKPVYFNILKAGRFGVNFIEDGVLHDTVRLCRIEPGTPNECDAR